MRHAMPLCLLAACASSAPPAPRSAGCTDPVAAQGVMRRPRAIQPALPALRIENLRFADAVECASGRCTAEGSAPSAPATEDGATTPPPAVAWVQVLRPGAAVTVPPRANRDLLGVTLVGELSLERPAAPQVAPVRAGAWTAFMVPEGDAVLRCVGDAPAAAVLVTAQGDAPVADRRPEVETVDLVTAQDLSWAGGAVHARIAFESPRSPRASLGVLIAADDAPVAEHVHERAWELLAAVSAAGRLHVPAQSVPGVPAPLVARDRTVTAGSIVYVPAGVRHGWVPDGTRPLIAVQVYAPAGPEQRFRGLAAASAEAR